MQNILIIEDEKPLAEALKTFMERSGYAVALTYDGQSGFECALEGGFDVVVLDIMLPQMDGFQVLKALRERQMSVPVLMLTARIKIDDKVSAFACGADDYLTKPFEVRELLARVNALLRRGRAGMSAQCDIHFGDLTVAPSTMSVFCGEKSAALTKKELDLLRIFLENPGQVISKDQILRRVWGYESDVEYNSAEVYVSFLRKKIKSVSSAVSIKAARGIGYMILAGKSAKKGGDWLAREEGLQ